MKKQWFITLVLLVSLAMVSYTSAAAPIVNTFEEIALPSEEMVEGEAVEGQDLPQGASAGWWTTVQEDIRQSEYHVTWQDHTYLSDLEAAYQAPNRAHNLRTYFTPTGIRVVPRTPPLSPPRSRGGSPAGAGGGWEWGLTLTGYGYAGDIQSMDAAELSASANRFEYRRGDIVEWYLNDEQGLEQGFTISRQPSASSRQPSTIVLDLAISGNLAPALADEGQAVEFAIPGGERVLRYSDLHVTDAAGRQLPAQMSLTTQHAIRITLDDSTALYPVTIAPTITGLSPAAPTGPVLSGAEGLSTSADWTAESDQDSAYFGYSVSTAGDVNGDGYSDVIVGAYRYDNGEDGEGRAYVYHGSATGLVTTTAWFTESNQIGACFGISTGAAGDVNGDGYADVVVGAHAYDNPEAEEGRAYVYHGSATGLSATPDWTAESDQAGAYFGRTVSTAGDVNGDGYSDVIVGAYYYTNGQTDEGAVFVYHGSATGLSVSADWMAESDQGSTYFGLCLGTAGDVNGDGYSDIIVGAWQYDNPTFDEGAAFVWYGSAAGLGPNGTPANADWMAESNNWGFAFGGDVGTAGDVNGDGYSDVIIGAQLYNMGIAGQGAVFVWFGSESGLGPNGDFTNYDWMARGNRLDSMMGRSAGTAGDVNGDGYADVIVGAYKYDNGHTDEGAAFVWYGSVTGLGANGTPANAGWTAEGDQGSAYFGQSVSTAGDVNGDGYSDVVVGAYGYDSPDTDEGAAFVYHGAADGLSDTAAWTAEGNQDSAYFGISVSTAGDVNGDGYSDVIVGAHAYDNGEDNEGRAYVYHGSATGLITTTAWFTESNQVDAYFGISVGTAGDVNGDGYADVVVGAHGYDNPEAEEGRAYVYHGSATGLSATPDWTAEGDQAGANFGLSVGTAGDVNGDGYSDVIVGVQGYDNGEDNEGRAYVYHGSATGLSATADWAAESDQADAYFGLSVGTAGDVNGDGYADVIVGASYYNGVQTDEGRAYVYHGSATGLSATADWTADETDQYNARFGNSVGTAGDVNGDGYAEVIVGAYYYDGGHGDEGRAYLYHGSATGLSASADWTAESNQLNGVLGGSVGTAGDVNGDGYADVIVGAYGYDHPTNEGVAFVWHGSATGLGVNGDPTNADWMAESNQDPAYFGYSVSTAGDVNGDGYAEVIVGAFRYDNGQTDEGAAFVYYGNGGDGLDLLPRQLRTDGSVHIAPLGLSDSPTAVQLRLTGRMPLGREDVKLEWQVAPLGTPFAATTVISGTSATWTDVLTTGVVITQNVTGLTQGTPYHWRARLLYRPGNRLGQAAGRWIHVPWNGWTEKDLRTADGPITGLAASNDSPTILGDATTLTATADGVYIAYTWAFGDGDSGSGAVAPHTYPAVGVYTATITATNSVDIVTATTIVTVDEAIAGLAATNDSPTELGEATTLTATITAGSNVAYTWAFGDGDSGSGAVAPHIYPAVDVYTATVTATNSLGVVVATTVVTVDEAIAGLAATNDSPTELGEATTLTAIITAGSNVAYTWAFGDGDTGSGAVEAHTYPGVGVYTAIVTASNSVGELATTTTVTITDVPIAGLSAINDSPTELGEATTLTATITAGSNVTYVWDFGDGTPAGAGAMVTHIYPAVDVYTATVTATNSIGFATTDTIVTIVESDFYIYLPLVLK